MTFQALCPDGSTEMASGPRPDDAEALLENSENETDEDQPAGALHLGVEEARIGLGERERVDALGDRQQAAERVPQREEVREGLPGRPAWMPPS